MVAAAILKKSRLSAKSHVCQKSTSVIYEGYELISNSYQQ